MKLLKDSSLPELDNRSKERRDINSDQVSILSKFQTKVSNYNYKNQVPESEATSDININERNLHKARKLEYQ